MFIGIVDESKASVIFNSYRWFCDLLGCLCVVFLTFGSLSVLRSSITLNKLNNDKLFHSNSLCVFFFFLEFRVYFFLYQHVFSGQSVGFSTSGAAILRMDHLCPP